MRLLREAGGEDGILGQGILNRGTVLQHSKTDLGGESFMTDPSAYTHTSQPQTNHTDTVSLLSCDPAGLRLIIPPQAEFIIEKL